ncbi:MAG: sodium-dependent transporter [Oscillospiraceae bacterium]|nr:sodium-dependent transporter [Oscillospiraceae bacterium]
MKEKLFSTGFGFLMTSVGAAVGLGNIWGFPYRLGEGGGFVFLAIYVACVLLAGIPLLYAELKLGRLRANSPASAYKIAGGGFAGWVGLAACFVVLCYYLYFGGLVLREIILALGIRTQGNLFWQALFGLSALVIVLGGLNSGVEKCSKIMVPALIAVLAALAVYALRSNGARDALSFMFRPGLGRLSAQSFKRALGQALFSLSIGQCVMVSFGSYLQKDAPIARYAAVIPALDTAVALLASLTVMPFVFASDGSPSAGPSVLFDVMPEAFASMRNGRLLALAFFVPVFFAALTSAVSMLETQASAVAAEARLPHGLTAGAILLLALLFGLPLSLRESLYPLYELVSEKILMTSCSLVTCFIFLRGKKSSLPELSPKGKSERLLDALLKFSAPAMLIYSVVA